MGGVQGDRMIINKYKLKEIAGGFACAFYAMGQSGIAVAWGLIAALVLRNFGVDIIDKSFMVFLVLYHIGVYTYSIKQYYKK